MTTWLTVTQRRWASPPGADARQVSHAPPRRRRHASGVCRCPRLRAHSGAGDASGRAGSHMGALLSGWAAPSTIHPGWSCLPHAGDDGRGVTAFRVPGSGGEDGAGVRGAADGVVAVPWVGVGGMGRPGLGVGGDVCQGAGLSRCVRWCVHGDRERPCWGRRQRKRRWCVSHQPCCSAVGRSRRRHQGERSVMLPPLVEFDTRTAS